MNAYVQQKAEKNDRSSAGTSYADSGGTAADKQPAVQRKENHTGLPDTLKTGLENLSGYSMNDVKVHYNSSRPAQLQALAYAQGTDIHIAPGQERHLPHEAWHVVQQKQGRVNATRQLKAGTSVNDDAGLEHEADLMGDKAMRLPASSNRSLSEAGVSGNVYQRKIGFELQPTNVIISKKTQEGAWTPFTGKNKYDANYGRVFLERDGKNPELTTDAFSRDEDPKEVSGTVGVISKKWPEIVDDVAKGAFLEYKDEYNKDKEDEEQHAKEPKDIIKIEGEKEPYFDVQSTVSLPLDKVPELISRIYEQVSKTFPQESVRSGSKEIKGGKVKAPQNPKKGELYKESINKVPFRRRNSFGYTHTEKTQPRKEQADRGTLSFLHNLDSSHGRIHKFINEQKEVEQAGRNKVKGFFDLSIINLKALMNASNPESLFQPGVKSGTPVLIKSHLGGIYQTLNEAEKLLVKRTVKDLEGEEEFNQWYTVNKKLSWETINRFKFRPIDYYKRIEKGADPMAYFEGFAEANTNLTDTKSEKNVYGNLRGHIDYQISQGQKANPTQEEAQEEHKGNYSQEYDTRTGALRDTWNKRLAGNPELAVIELRELGSIALTPEELAPWAEASFSIYRLIDRPE